MDWPSSGVSGGIVSLIADQNSPLFGATATAGSAWPGANRALYLPSVIEQVVTFKAISFIVTTQSGDLDVGIYNEAGVRLVSSGSTAVAAPGVQVVDIADTTVGPGVYFLAMCVSNTTAAFIRVNNASPGAMQACSIQQQSLGSVELPATASFASPANAYFPRLAGLTSSAVV
jgi:hypothetical protein